MALVRCYCARTMHPRHRIVQTTQCGEKHIQARSLRSLQGYASVVICVTITITIAIAIAITIVYDSHVFGYLLFLSSLFVLVFSSSIHRTSRPQQNFHTTINTSQPDHVYAFTCLRAWVFSLQSIITTNIYL